MIALPASKPTVVRARHAKQCRRVVRSVRNEGSVKTTEAPPKTAPAKPSTLPPVKKNGKFLPLLMDKTLVVMEDAISKVADRCTVPSQVITKSQGSKPKIIVLGSGWAAHNFIKTINNDRFDVVVVSPRNYFMFTPMLPSTAVGSIEFRSLCEPVRVANPKVQYLEASCEMLDVERKVALCTSQVAFENGQTPRFEMEYDLAVVAVGEKPATYGVPGVREHCFFMKEINDAVNLRRRIAECFELASLPGSSDADRAKALHFVVVGGGATGVEFAGTLSDFVRQDLTRKYPDLMPYIRVTLFEVGQAILTQFDQTLAEQAMNNLESAGVSVKLGKSVVAVNQDNIVLGGGEHVEYGICVWSAGNEARPLVKTIASQIPEQAAVFRSKLTVDDFMRVAGAEDVIALGDCSVMQERLPPTAQVAAQQGAYVARMLNKGFNIGKGGANELPPNKLIDDKSMSAISGGRAVEVVGDEKLEFCTRPFEFLNLGMLAYVGNEKALVQAQAGSIDLKLYGSLAYLMWQSVYVAKQVSLRNRVLILFDWLKASLFGRDISQF